MSSDEIVELPVRHETCRRCGWRGPVARLIWADPKTMEQDHTDPLCFTCRDDARRYLRSKGKRVIRTEREAA